MFKTRLYGCADLQTARGIEFQSTRFEAAWRKISAYPFMWLCSTPRELPILKGSGPRQLNVQGVTHAHLLLLRALTFLNTPQKRIAVSRKANVHCGLRSRTEKNEYIYIYIHPAWKTENTAVGIRHTDQMAPSIQKSWH
jgi:hypothetical protein